eukprot:m.661108 g.661108  ORF g.661108 m.661108 type:complete len:161 (-) comp58461_c2_seq4:123-605(-)
MNGVRGSVVSPQHRGRVDKFHCVRCRHFLEGLVWWFVSLNGKQARDNVDEFILSVRTKIGPCVLSMSFENPDGGCGRLTHTVPHCLPDSSGLSTECSHSFHLLRNSSLCQYHRFHRCLQYFDLADINSRSYSKMMPSGTPTAAAAAVLLLGCPSSRRELI